MNNRLIRALLLLVLVPCVFTVSLYFLSMAFQPKALDTTASPATDTEYIDSARKYYLKGDALFLPGELFSAREIEAVSSEEAYTTFFSTVYKEHPLATTIESFSEILCDDALVDSYYDGTIFFTMRLQDFTNYGMIVPERFCNMSIYVNGKLRSSSAKPGEESCSPFTQLVLFPESNSAFYVIAITVHNPENYVLESTDTILFSSEKVAARIYGNLRLSAVLLLAFLVFCIIFFTVHNMALSFYRPVKFFLLLLFGFLLNVLTQDCNSLFEIMFHIPYQLGLVLQGLSTPVFMVLMVLLSYAMFPTDVPKRMWISLLIAQVVPLINVLCLGQFAALSIAASLIQAIPYALCMYIFVISYDKNEEHSLLFGLSVLLIESGSLLYYATQSLPVPVRYSASFGMFTLTIVQVIILSAKYAEQAKAENFLNEELSHKLAEKQASENAFLNAQMKPHFLYNTLNTIADCCVTDSSKAKALINSLSEYLKLIVSLDNMEETVPLKRELELVNAYSSIEKERFPSINFYQDFPFRLPDINMPPITIQPLIENAIKHGVRKLDKPGIITLRITEDEDYVSFFVSDNGTGMNPETIAKLFVRPKENKSIGIYNIDKRLRNLYNDGLSVESTPGLGTCISFRIPKRR